MFGKGKKFQKHRTKKVIYLQQKQRNNNIKLGRKQQNKTEFIHSYLASEKESDDKRSAPVGG